jgi:epoxyqueuosine reductase
LLDRPAAIRSGIGWQGRNGSVIVRDLGSWVVLGELILDLELEPDSPAEGNRCGGCNRCQAACPTGALRAPYSLDISRCLSHLTQMPGSIPESLRPLLGTRIYGCDRCQEVCPHNRRARPGNHPEFHPSQGLGASPDLISLLNLSTEEFKQRVAPTTIGWIRRSRFRRNVAVALGNLGDPAAIPALEVAAQDQDLIVKEHATWALNLCK